MWMNGLFYFLGGKMMNDFEKRIRVKLNSNTKGKPENGSVLGYAKFEKSCGINPKYLKNSVLTTDFNAGKGRDERD